MKKFVLLVYHWKLTIEHQNWKLKIPPLKPMIESKSPAKHFNQNVKANWNQIHPIEQPSSYPVNYCSRISSNSRNRPNSSNRFSPYRPSRSKSPSYSGRLPVKFRPRHRYRDREFFSNRTPSRSRYPEFYNQRRNSKPPCNSSVRYNRYVSFSRPTLESTVLKKLQFFILTSIKTICAICVCI